MNRHSKEFQELLSRLRSGELTRDQAAAAYGVKAVTLSAWIRRSGEKVPDRRTDPNVVKSRLEATGFVPLTPERKDALKQAVDLVLRGGVSCYKAAKDSPGVNLRYLSELVRRERERLGLPAPVKVPCETPAEVEPLKRLGIPQPIPFTEPRITHPELSALEELKARHLTQTNP